MSSDTLPLTAQVREAWAVDGRLGPERKAVRVRFMVGKVPLTQFPSQYPCFFCQYRSTDGPCTFVHIVLSLTLCIRGGRQCH